MHKNLTFLKNKEFHILHTISDDSVYQVSHQDFKENLLYISFIDKKILISMVVGEFSEAPTYVPKQYKCNYFKDFINCLKTSFFQIYKPLEAMEKSLEDSPPQDSDLGFEEFCQIEQSFKLESNQEDKNDLLKDAHRVGKQLVFDFICDIENLDNQLIEISKYFQDHQEQIQKLTH